MGHVDGGFFAGTDEGINGRDEEVAVPGVEALAGFVQNEEAGPLHQRAGQKD